MRLLLLPDEQGVDSLQIHHKVLLTTNNFRTTIFYNHIFFSLFTFVSFVPFELRYRQLLLKLLKEFNGYCSVHVTLRHDEATLGYVTIITLIQTCHVVMWLWWHGVGGTVNMLSGHSDCHSQPSELIYVSDFDWVLVLVQSWNYAELSVSERGRVRGKKHPLCQAINAQHKR